MAVKNAVLYVKNEPSMNDSGYNDMDIEFDDPNSSQRNTTISFRYLGGGGGDLVFRAGDRIAVLTSMKLWSFSGRFELGGRAGRGCSN